MTDKDPGAQGRRDTFTTLRIVQAWLCWRTWMACGSDQEKELRAMTQTKFAETSGVSGPTISKICNRKKHEDRPDDTDPAPVSDLWPKLVDAFGMSLVEVINEALRWQTTPYGKAWLDLKPKQRGPERLPAMPEKFLEALQMFRDAGHKVSERAYGYLLANLEGHKELTADRWYGQIEMVVKWDDMGKLPEPTRASELLSEDMKRHRVRAKTTSSAPPPRGASRAKSLPPKRDDD